VVGPVLTALNAAYNSNLSLSDMRDFNGNIIMNSNGGAIDLGAFRYIGVGEEMDRIAELVPSSPVVDAYSDGAAYISGTPASSPVDISASIDPSMMTGWPLLPQSWLDGLKIVYSSDGSSIGDYNGPINATSNSTFEFFCVSGSGKESGPAEMVANFGSAELLTEYKVTASADNGATISPSGEVTAQEGDSPTFYFTAKSGYQISSVTGDGVPLSQTDIANGSYTFYNVQSDHTIDVKSSYQGQKTGVTLEVDVAEGKGYAEYSINGGASQKYVSEVTLPGLCNLTLTAHADAGYVFTEWRTEEGATITDGDISFSDNSSSQHLYLYFAADNGSGGGNGNGNGGNGNNGSGNNGNDNGDHNIIWWILALIFLLIIIGVVVALLRRRNKD
jgi:hypothetical protein